MKFIIHISGLLFNSSALLGKFQVSPQVLKELNPSYYEEKELLDNYCVKISTCVEDKAKLKQDMLNVCSDMKKAKEKILHEADTL